MRYKVYPDELLREDREFILKKLGLSEKVFSDILLSPNKSFRDYPTSSQLRIRLSNIKASLNNIGICKAKGVGSI